MNPEDYYVSPREERHLAIRAENRDVRAQDEALDSVEWSERRRKVWRAQQAEKAQQAAQPGVHPAPTEETS